MMNDECPHCREYSEKGSRFCGACGRQVNECPRCKEYAEAGNRFCGACGRQVGECPKCKEYSDDGRTFCGACGRRLAWGEDPGQFGQGSAPNEHMPMPSRGLGFVEIILLIACVSLMIIAVLQTIIMLINFSDVYSFLSDKVFSLFLIVPFPYTIFRIQELALQMYWVLIAAIIVVCVIAALYEFMVKTRNFKDIAKPGAAENTAMFWVAVSLCATTLIAEIVVFLTLSAGSDINTPDFGDRVEQLFEFANAAVWEEVISRLLYIGVPVMIISLLVNRKKESLRCLIGGFDMSKTAIIFIIISSIIFGLAHYPGWGDQVWKVIEITISGLFFGYIFVRFGLYASILLHFINDYLSAFEWVGEGLAGILILLILGAGLFALFYVIKRLWDSRGQVASLPLFKNGYIKNE